MKSVAFNAISILENVKQEHIAISSVDYNVSKINAIHQPMYESKNLILDE